MELTHSTRPALNRPPRPISKMELVQLPPIQFLPPAASLDWIRPSLTGSSTMTASPSMRSDDAASIQWPFQRFYGDKVKMAFAFAELLNQEALALQADGVDIIQFDEPAFNVYMKDAADWGVQALERAAQGLTCTTA